MVNAEEKFKDIKKYEKKIVNIQKSLVYDMLVKGYKDKEQSHTIWEIFETQEGLFLSQRSGFCEMKLDNNLIKSLEKLIEWLKLEMP